MRTIALLLLSAPLWAATTTVTKTVINPDGTPAKGDAYIRISAACNSGGAYVGDKTVHVSFAPDPVTHVTTFTVALVPNDTCVISGAAGAAWVPSTPYGTGDRVAYNSGTWLALAASTGVTPGTNPQKWAAVSTSYFVSWALTGGRAWPETWIVPTSSTPLSVDQVKVAQADLPTVPAVIVTGGGAGLTYTTTPSDGQYIRWNSTQSAWQPVTFVDLETVSGTIDGANAAFTVANAPSPAGSLVLFRNGLAQKSGGYDYSISGNTITFVDAAIPQPGDTLIAWYRY